MKAATTAPASGALLLRLPAVRAATGLSRTLIFKMVKEGRFPASVKAGTRAVAWRRTDIEAWADSLPSNTKEAA